MPPSTAYGSTSTVHTGPRQHCRRSTDTSSPGISRADSVVIDAHKMLHMPALITAVLFGRLGAADRTFQRASTSRFTTEDGSYSWWDSGLRTLECTKRMMALELYASLSQHGTDLFADHVTRTFDLARWFADVLRGSPDFEVAIEPEANIVCFRHTAKRDSGPR